MKYDLVVAGAGPAGLMAAGTAARDGLKVLLVERRKDVTENILCGQFTNISMLNVSGRMKYGYAERLSLEAGTDGNRVHFPDAGFTLDYRGPLRPYYNYVHFSPGGYQVYREKDRFFGFFWEKETILRTLWEAAEKAGVEIRNETVAEVAENLPGGVRLSLRSKAGPETVEARRAIAADGKKSLIVESLGMNRSRQVIRPTATAAVGYLLEGVETELRLNSWICFTVPSLNPHMNLWMFMMAGDRNVLGSTSTGGRGTDQIDRLMRLPYFARWFRHARVIKTLVRSTGAPSARSSILEPVAGNVLVVGDAAVVVETSNPGAIACGFRAAKATLLEMDGKNGYADYTRWWQGAFDCNDPDYLKAAGRFFSINAHCTDAEVDYLYNLVQDQVGVPAVLISRNLERVEKERPALFTRLSRLGIHKSLGEVNIDLTKVLAGDLERPG